MLKQFFNLKLFPKNNYFCKSNYSIMKILYHTYLIAILVATLCGLGNLHATTSIEKENIILLHQLDSIIANNKGLVNQKEIRINGLRETLRKAKTNSDRFGITRQLYDEYLVFDSDSSLHYASETRKIVERTMPEDYDLLTEWKRNDAFI